jgi:glutaryl-CoA dehydrogenase
MSTPTTLPPFEPLDPAGIDDLLSGDEKAVRASVRQLCADRIDPYVADWFERGEIDDLRGLAKEIGALGVLGMHLEGYGCAGMSATEYGLACLELEASDSGIRSLVSVQGSLAMFAIWRWGSKEQKNQWLPQMAAGEVIGCFGLTESDVGSDPASMRTRARKDGSKLFSTDAAMRHAVEAVQIFGALGVHSSSRVQRLFRDSKALQIFDGTSEIHTLMIGRDALNAHR